MSTGRLGAGDTAIQPTIFDAKGDLLTATAGDTPARIAVGSNGQYLKADSTASTGLAWATLPSSGKVLQVVSTTLTSGNFTTSSTSFVDVTNFTATITPASASSRIMVFMTATCSASSTSGGSNADMRFALVRTSTTLTQARFDVENNTASSFVFGIPVSLHIVDSPSTTSATTYKLQVCKVNFSASITVNANTTNSAMLTLMEIGA